VLQGQRAAATPAATTAGLATSPTAATAPRSLAPTAVGWAVGLLTTLLVLGTPYLLFGYHSPELHLVLDSVDACAAVLLSYLVYGRFVRSRRLQDLLLAEGLAVLAVAGLVLSLLLELTASWVPERLDVWLPVLLRTVGALLVVAGALTPDRLLTGAWRRRAHVATWALVGAAVVALWLAHDHLPEALSQSPPSSAQHPVITGHPALIAAQVVGAACFLISSLAFAWRSGRRPDELLRWLGPGCALVGFARLSYALFPSLYSGWLYTGDVLRTTGYLVLLFGAAREIRHYWSAQSRAAVLEDRRRLARELHDGLVQELAYLRMGAVALPDDEVQHELLAACDRALDEARAAVDALGRSPDEPLGFVLHRAARQVAERYQARVDVDLDDSVGSDPELRHALVRITREAVSNAIRHGRPGRISVRLSREDCRCRLLVEDDGTGFDPAVVKRDGTGYGLTSMADRARTLGGAFRIESRPGHGTQVSVTW
jgi:signal transduction histidine kinase